MVRRRQSAEYSPIMWTEYFDEAHDIRPNDSQDSFRVYLSNFRQPYAPNRQPGAKIHTCDPQDTYAEQNQYSQTPTLVLLHGGGYSGLTWSLFCKSVQQFCRCRFLAIDLRGHGDSKTNNDDDFSVDTLVADIINVTHATHRICGFVETPKLILIGHSMGGAIAVKCATRCEESLPSLVGFVVIDVVEGTAKDALPAMMSVIRTRPKKFPSLENAIEWSLRSGMTKNVDSARVSMAGNLLNIETQSLAIHDIIGQVKPELGNNISSLAKQKFHIGIDQLLNDTYSAPSIPHFDRPPLPPRVAALKGNIAGLSSISLNKMSIAEESGSKDEKEVEDVKEVVEKEEQNSEGNYKKPPVVEKTGYCWRTCLSRTQPFWNEWFEGLSSELLAAPVQGKFLLLAGIDRLDKTLTIGQMQGKFMMKVLPKCGHAVHEDVPEEVSKVISDFLIRNRFTTQVE